MSLDNLYAPVQQGTPGLVPDYSPITDAITAIYQRRAQMQMHADQMARDAAKMKQDDQLARDRLAEEARYHTAEMGNMTEQRRLQEETIAANKAKELALEQEKAKAGQVSGMDLARKFAGSEANIGPGPQQDALLASLKAQGIQSLNRNVEGPTDRAAHLSDEELVPGVRMPNPTVVPAETHQVTDVTAPLTGASFTLDQQAEQANRAAMADAARKAWEAEAGPQRGDSVGEAQRQAMLSQSPAIAALYASGIGGVEARKTVEDRAKTQFTQGQSNDRAAEMRVTQSMNAGNAQTGKQVDSLYARMKESAKESKLPELRANLGELTDIEKDVASKKGGYIDELTKRKIGMMFNRGPFGDKDAIASDPSNKNGIPEQIRSWFQGRTEGGMTPETRAIVIRSVKQWKADVDERARTIFNQNWTTYGEGDRTPDEQNLFNEQSRSNFGSFKFFKDFGGKYGPSARKPAGGGKGGASASVGLKGAPAVAATATPGMSPDEILKRHGF